MSNKTTYFGPRVSYRTSAAQSDQTVIVDARPARVLSRVTTASATSLVLEDGEMAIAAHSGNTAKLVWRSGVTTYQSTLTGSVL